MSCWSPPKISFFANFLPFFNADLVESKIHKNQGAVEFIDDYLAWITGDSIEHNVKLLLDIIISHGLSWVKASSIIFQTKKTHLTYFTQKKRHLRAPKAD